MRLSVNVVSSTVYDVSSRVFKSSFVVEMSSLVYIMSSFVNEGSFCVDEMSSSFNEVNSCRIGELWRFSFCLLSELPFDQRGFIAVDASFIVDEVNSYVYKISPIVGMRFSVDEKSCW